MASFKKLESGWQYRVSYKDGDKYRTKSGNGFSTKREAQLAAAKFEELLNKGNKINHKIVFLDYFENWYEVYRKGKNSIRNDKDIELAINVARKFFNKTLILDIDRNKYQEFLNWYGENRADASVRKVHIYVKNCLLDALQEGIIYRDPTHKVMVKGTKGKKSEEMKYLNEDEAKRVMTELQKGLKMDWDSRFMILLSLATGMRFSEVLALKWKDIDFKNKTVSINKTFDYSITRTFGPPKTGSSNRVITVDDDTLHLMKRFKLANRFKYSTYVFMDEFHNHASNSAVNKSLKRACQRAEAKEITFHSLRHTHCSLLIYHGVNIKYISKRLGHSNIMTTYQIYGHILDEMEQRESQEVDNMMDALYNAK